MTVMLDWLSDDYPTFPQFQVMLREYERDLAEAEKKAAAETRRNVAQAAQQKADTEKKQAAAVKRQAISVVAQPTVGSGAGECRTVITFGVGGAGLTWEQRFVAATPQSLQCTCPYPVASDATPDVPGWHDCRYCHKGFELKAPAVPQTHAHRIAGPEKVGVIHRCQACGKYFDGGVGAVCDL